MSAKIVVIHQMFAIYQLYFDCQRRKQKRHLYIMHWKVFDLRRASGSFVTNSEKHFETCIRIKNTRYFKFTWMPNAEPTNKMGAQFGDYWYLKLVKANSSLNNAFIFFIGELLWAFFSFKFIIFREMFINCHAHCNCGLMCILRF